MNLNDNCKRVLQQLYNSHKGLNVQSLSTRTRIESIALLVNVINILEKKELIHVSDDVISLSDFGQQAIAYGQINISITSKWKDKIPAQFTGKKIGINKFYIPRVSLLDKNT